MKTALQIFIGVVASLLMLVVSSLNAQCVQDTVVIVAPLSETIYGAHHTDTLACYTSTCSGCEKTFGVLVPPMDGCITIAGPANPSASVVILRNCNEVLLDTCVSIAPQVNIVTICYSSLDTTQMIICSFDSAQVIIRAYIQPGSPPLGNPSVALDTLCPVVGLSPKITVQDSILIRSINFLGQPWESGPRIDIYRVGDGYIHRKFWDVIR